MTRRTEWAWLAAVVAAAGALYCWRLGQQGWANEYYAAAVQSAVHDWSSLLWAGVEWGGHEALDKPPLFVWPMALSARLLGFSTWSMLLPQVLMTLATVVLLERAVSRTHGALAGLLAAAVFATMPVVVVLARFNDPDVAVTFLSVAAAYAVVRYLGGGRRGWVVLAGGLLGLAFLCKWMAAFLAVPALVTALVVAERRRAVRPVLVAAGACAAAGLWWVLLYAVWPVPHPTPDGGSSLADLLLGRNGFSRVVTADVTTRNGVSGAPGLARVVRWPMDGQLGWYVPASVLALWVLHRGWPTGSTTETAGAVDGVAGDVRTPADRVRSAATALWCTWFLVVTAVLSFMGGPMHPYYLHVIAPGLAAVLGLGVAAARDRSPLPAAAADRVGLLAPATVLTGGMALVILDSHDPLPQWWQRVIELATVATVVLVAIELRRPRPRVAAAAVVTAVVASSVGPLGFDALTVSHPVLGANPTAGPELRIDTRPLPEAVVDLVRTAPGRYAAAVPMAAHAAMLQLQVDRPVLPIGGYTGRAASPRPETVRSLVAAGDLRYLVLTGPYDKAQAPKDFEGRPTAEIVTWARQTGCVVPGRWGAVTVIDLSHHC